MAELKSARILLIEPEGVKADIFKRIIEAGGHCVDLVSSGAEGLSRHDAEAYHAISIHSYLSDMAGVDTARQLLGRYPGLPITLITDDGDEALIAEALALGVLNYVTRDSNGKYLKLLPSLIDQSLRMASQLGAKPVAMSEHQHVRQRMMDAARLAKLGFWEWDEIEDRAIFCSDELANIFGVTIDEFLHQASSMSEFSQQIHPDNREQYLRANKKMLNSKTGFEIECRAIKADGTYIHIAERAEVEIDADGRVIRSYGIIQDITQLVETQEALLESEARHTRAARIAKLGHWAWDEVESRGIYVSGEYAALFDMSVDDIDGSMSSIDGLVKLVHADDRERYRDIMRAAEDAKSGYEIVLRILLPNGQVRHVREIAEAILDAEGQHIQTVGTTADITEQVKSDALIAERDTQIEQAIRVANMANWIWDEINDRYQYVSPRMAYIYGSTPDEFDAKRFIIEDPLLMAHPDDHDSAIHAMLEGSKTGQPYQFEYRIIWDDGSIHTIRDSIAPQFDLLGNKTHTIGCTQDITSFVEAQEKLYEAQLNYRWAAEIGKLGHYVWDETSGKCEHCSDELAGMFDMDTEEYLESLRNLDRHHELTTHPSDLERYRRTMLEFRESGTDIDIVYRTLRAGGGIRYLHEFGRRIHDNDGQIIRILGIIRDVTDEKVAEQEILNARNEAESANRLKSEFLAHMSHELRTPLNAITGFSQIMEQQTFGKLGHPKYLEYAGDVNRSGQHLLNVINDILDLSKIEAGQTELSNAPFDVRDAITTCVNMVKGSGSSQSERITTELPEKLSMLNADERIFDQILLNILSNADKFTPEIGSISISVAYAENRGTKVIVSDTGCGISSADIPKILEPFGQVKLNSHLAKKGTGLGLSLSQKFMELHGGTLSLDSEPGVGTTVTLVFPPERTVHLP